MLVYFLLSILGPIYFPNTFNGLIILNKAIVGVLASSLVIFRILKIIQNIKDHKLSNPKLGKKLLNFINEKESDDLYNDM